MTKKELINRINLIIKTLFYGLPYKWNNAMEMKFIDNELYFKGEDQDGNEVWTKCLFDLTLGELKRQAENMSDEYAWELSSAIALNSENFEKEGRLETVRKIVEQNDATTPLAFSDDYLKELEEVLTKEVLDKRIENGTIQIMERQYIY